MLYIKLAQLVLLRASFFVGALVASMNLVRSSSQEGHITITTPFKRERKGDPDLWLLSSLPSRVGMPEVHLFIFSFHALLERGIQGAATLEELGVELHRMETEGMEKGTEHGKNNVQDV